MAAYTFSFSRSGSPADVWERTFPLVSDDEAQAEGLRLIQTQAAIPPESTLKLSVSEAPKAAPNRTLGFWVWTAGQARWHPA